MKRPRILTGRWRSSLPISRSSALEMERADGTYQATGRRVAVFQIGNPDPNPVRDVTHLDLSSYPEEETDADR